MTLFSAVHRDGKTAAVLKSSKPLPVATLYTLPALDIPPALACALAWLAWLMCLPATGDRGIVITFSAVDSDSSDSFSCPPGTADGVVTAAWFNYKAHRYMSTASINLTRLETSSKWSSYTRDKPLSYFWALVTTRAAEFITLCKLSVVTLGDSASTALQ